MTKPPQPEELTRLLVEKDARARSWLKRSQEAVVFGSMGAGCADASSDLDVLFVGSGQRVRSNGVDAVWISPEHTARRSWQGSELALHIAHYGVWLKGDGAWRRTVFAGDHAVAKKRRIIAQRLVDLYLLRTQLSAMARARFFGRVALDVYRLDYLLRGQAVPPRQALLRRAADESLRTLLLLSAEASQLGPVMGDMALAILGAGGGSDIASTAWEALAPFDFTTVGRTPWRLPR